MATQLTVTLSDRLSQRIRKVATLRRQDVVEWVEIELAHALSSVEKDIKKDEVLDLSEPDEAAEREMQAYIALHPVLKQEYFGKHVAIHGGRVVDVDDNFDALFDRVDRTYPDEFVWLSQVKEEPIDIFTVRSPRFTAGEHR
jgi:hypothetical protein